MYAILKTNGRTVHWDKCRNYQFIGCIGIRRKDGRNYIRAHLRNRRTYQLVLREDAKNLRARHRVSIQFDRGGLTRSSDMCRIKALET